jgi:hypothetical protein
LILNDIMNKDISRKKFINMIGAGIISIPFLSKQVLGDIFFRDIDKNSYKLLTENDLIGYSKLDGSNSYNYSGTIERDVNGYIKKLIRTSGLSFDIVRDSNNRISTISDGTKTWTFTRNENNMITNWSVAT